MEHGLKDIKFYVQKHLAPRAICYITPLVRNKPLWAHAFLRWVYRGLCSDVIYWINLFASSIRPLSVQNWARSPSVKAMTGVRSLLWPHNGRGSVSNHQPHDCLLKRLFRRRSKKTSNLRVTGLCAGNSPETGEFPAQMASNAENVSIWWRHHGEFTSHDDMPVKYIPSIFNTPLIFLFCGSYFLIRGCSHGLLYTN